jgi:hypothetical protein
VTTPTDELCTAADKLRALAAAAADDSGNTIWKASRHFPDQPDSTFTTLWAVGVRPLLRGGGGAGRPPAYVSAPVGDYAAAMDPAVGAALAKILRETAALHEHDARPGHGGCQWCADEDWPCADIRNALAVARQINGTAS